MVGTRGRVAGRGNRRKCLKGAEFQFYKMKSSVDVLMPLNCTPEKG